MSLLLAPYSNAMRLGQGFNSYTQQICIDDAVVVDPNRAENIVTNDGTTMRIMAQKSAAPSAWTRQKEVITENPATAVLVENAKKAKDEVHLIEEELAKEPENEAESKPKSEVKSQDKDKPEAKKDHKAERVEAKQPETEMPEAEEKTDIKPPEEETGSVDEVPDADEAREEAKSLKEQKEEGKPIVSEPKAAKPQDDVKSSPPADGSARSLASRLRSSSLSKPETTVRSPPDATKTDRAGVLANLKANDKSSGQAAQSKGDEEDVDREAIAANLQANAQGSAGADPGADTAKPTASTKRPIRRGASADRANGREAKATKAPLDRAAIRAKLGQTSETSKDPATQARESAEKTRREEEERELLTEQRVYQKELLLQSREEERARRAEEREEQRTIRQEKREWDAKRREEARKAISDAASLKAASKEDLDKILAQNQFVERFNGMSEQKHKYDFDPTAPRGPSQTVTYTSRFVDRLSDVTDDMSVSGSLSIKAGKIGGSGKGSFVDSDKFKESDLNFYISVKVVNQTINFKDALVYNPLRSVNENNFREVYGDSFISGFIEGGEFNALVSMKIINKAKKTDIQAQAKIALTAGAVQVEADANVGVARSNIETNTETTIQVSWSGGGHIKPMDQQWDIESLMATAARFPDLVADCPQRTYAVLTKYDSLRSFVARKPATYTPLQYENAQIYTGTMLDAFVSYKALYKRLSEQIFQVQGKTMEIQQWSDSEQQTVTTGPGDASRTGSKNDVTGLYPYREVNTRFEASLKGLSDARTAVRRQMARIVNEVDLIEKDPKLATDEDHSEPYQAPVAFEARIPTVEVPARLRLKTHPLSGRKIAAKPLSEEELKKAAAEDEVFTEGSQLFTSTEKLSEDEQAAMQNAVSNNPLIGDSFRVSSAVGDDSRGNFFSNLDYLKREWNIRSIRTEVYEGALVYLAVSYENGLLVEKGATRDNSRIKKFGPFFPGERINSASIEYGRVEGGGVKDTQVLSLRLFTNRGRGLIARALHSETSADKTKVTRDGKVYEGVTTLYLDVPFKLGSVKGFFGRSEDTPGTGKIWRLGIIWCRLDEKDTGGEEAQLGDDGDTMDSEDLALLQKDQSLGNKSLKDTQTALAQAQEQQSILQKQLQEANLSLKNSRNDVKDKNEQIEKMRSEANRKPTQTIEPQGGRYSGGENGWRPGDDCTALTRQTFPRSYNTLPKIIYGLSNINMEQGVRSCAMALDLADVSPSEFALQMSTFGGSYAYDMAASWMTLPDDLHLEHGSVSTWGTGPSDWDTFDRRVTFNQNFATPPKVCVWLQGFEYSNSYDFTSISCQTNNISAAGFTLRICSWAKRRFRGARAGWFAYPAEEDGKRVRSDRTIVNRSQNTFKETTPFHPGPFSVKPATFFAISEVDFGRNKIMRATVDGRAPNKEELYREFGTWLDSNMDHMHFTWIAIV